MSRQSISFTEPNDKWLREMVDSQEYSSKSELVNDLIRQARKQQVQIDWINRKLERSEQSGYTDLSKSEILNPYSFELVDHIRKGYRRCPYGSDSIYYKLNEGMVEIMAIVGRQEINERLLDED